MNINEFIMSHPYDHMMANTWRLIFERKSASTMATPSPQSIPDFTMLEQLLPEYRLIGLALANNEQRRPD